MLSLKTEDFISSFHFWWILENWLTTTIKLSRLLKLRRESFFKKVIWTLDRFNELFTKLEDLGVVEEISTTEMKAWKGPVHYISLQHVIDEESASTPLRIVSNSSLKSPGNPHTLNGILAKGPNMLSNPYKILIRFR